MWDAATHGSFWTSAVELWYAIVPDAGGPPCDKELPPDLCVERMLERAPQEVRNGIFGFMYQCNIGCRKCACNLSILVEPRLLNGRSSDMIGSLAIQFANLSQPSTNVVPLKDACRNHKDTRPYVSSFEHVALPQMIWFAGSAFVTGYVHEFFTKELTIGPETQEYRLVAVVFTDRTTKVSNCDILYRNRWWLFDCAEQDPLNSHRSVLHPLIEPRILHYKNTEGPMTPSLFLYARTPRHELGGDRRWHEDLQDD